MKRAWITLFGGVLVALLAYFGFYFAGTAHSRALEKSHEPELAWLQREFHLNQAEFAHICQMHEAYLTGCAERCHRIDMKGEELKHLLAGITRFAHDRSDRLRRLREIVDAATRS